MHPSVLVMKLLSVIDESYLRFLGGQLKKIIDQNTTSLDKSFGYIHNGYVYMVGTSNFPLRTSLQYKPTFAQLEDLKEELFASHDEWEKQYDQRESTLQLIRQNLSIATKFSKTAQDFRDMFPDHVLSLLKDIDLAERTRPSLEYVDGDDAHNTALAVIWPEPALIAYNQIKSSIDVSIGYRYFQ